MFNCHQIIQETIYQTCIGNDAVIIKIRKRGKIRRNRRGRRRRWGKRRIITINSSTISSRSCLLNWNCAC